eukprot:jgi/Chlat1/3073/Chrsp21S03384
MANVALTPNAVARINGGEVEFKPYVQVIDVKRIGAAGGAGNPTERYRLQLSDGQYSQQGMLATQLNHHVQSNAVKPGTVLQLDEFICNTVQNRRVIIILSLTVVADLEGIIGNPQPLSNDGTPAAAPAAAPPRAAPPPVMEQKPFPNGPPAGNGGYGGGYASSNGPHANGAAGGGYAGSSYGGGAGAGYSNGPYGASPAQPSASGAYGSAYGDSTVPPPMYGQNRAPIARNQAPAAITPIRNLNPYQNRWTIQARVAAKSDIRRYHNAKGEGKLASVDFVDSESWDMRATMFNDAVDKYYDMLEVGRIYFVSKAQLKPAKREFSNCKAEYEMTFDNNTMVEPCPDSDDIPRQTFELKPISVIENAAAGEILDVMGVVTSISQVQSIQRKNGQETTKQTMQILDQSARSVEICLWGDKCLKDGAKIEGMMNAGERPIIAVKAGRISDFNGRSVGTISSTQISINPDLPAAAQLRSWYDSNGASAIQSAVNLTHVSGGGTGSGVELRKFVAQIKAELGQGEKPDWVTIVGTLTFMKVDSMSYPACPEKIGDKNCNKKLQDQGNGTWYCERCSKTVTEATRRYILSASVSDCTGADWITAFDEAGTEMFGVDANTMHEWNINKDPRFAAALDDVNFKLRTWKLKVKQETYNDETRIKNTLVKSELVKFAAESERMLDNIQRLQANQPVYQSVSTSNAAAAPAASYGGYNQDTYGTSTATPTAAYAGAGGYAASGYGGGASNGPAYGGGGGGAAGGGAADGGNKLPECGG